MIYLTEKYKNFFKINNISSLVDFLNHFPSFVYDVFKSGKIREMASFVIWELKYIFNFFPNDSYLNIQDSNHLIIERNDDIANVEFSKKIATFNQSNTKYIIEVLNQNLIICFFDSYNRTFYGVDANDEHTLLSSKDGVEFDFFYRFNEKIFAIYVTKKSILLVNVGNKIYRKNKESSFDLTLELSSPRSFLRDNGSMSEDYQGNIYIAEYGLDWDKNHNWISLAYLYISKDSSQTWEKIDLFKEMGANKHLHLIFFDSTHNALLLTDGDNHKRLWINYTLADLNKQSNKNNKDGWYLYTKFHIMKGGFISAINFMNKTIMGSDYLGGTNFLIYSNDLKRFNSKVIPDPFRRSPVDTLLVINGKKQSHLVAELMSLENIENSKGLIMFTKDLNIWDKIIEYSGNSHKTYIISSSNHKLDEFYVMIKRINNKKNDYLTLRLTPKF
jgi:hypothetical protein